MGDYTKHLYLILSKLPRFGFPVNRLAIPGNGIYLFFERGETLNINGTTFDRIVRVGTHRGDGRLAKRLQQHYGNLYSMRGNKNASAFRRHVGGALLNRANGNDPRIPEWIRQKGTRPLEVEIEVSELLRNRFTFVCVQVDAWDRRREFEDALISLLAQHPVGEPSDSWLGNNALAPTIRKSGLWNVNSAWSTPANTTQLLQFEQMATSEILSRQTVGGTNRRLDTTLRIQRYR